MAPVPLAGYKLVSHSAPMRVTLVVGMLFVLLVLQGCDQLTEETQLSLSPPSVTTGLVTGDELPPHHVGTAQYGSEGPIALEGGMTSETWPKWARTAWPRACSHVQVRRLKTARLVKRHCAIESVDGDIPTERVRSTAYLDIQNALIPVVWNWSRFSEGEQASCKGDPLSENQRNLLITRSANDRNWQVSSSTEANPRDYNFQSDGVWETCQKLPEFLK